MFTVRLINTSTKYIISNWKCSCNELQKAGVPWPHILLGALSTKDKCYTELIARRWRKELLEPKNKADIWV
jgi:hypothetical protein